MVHAFYLGERYYVSSKYNEWLRHVEDKFINIHRLWHIRSNIQSTKYINIDPIRLDPIRDGLRWENVEKSIKNEKITDLILIGNNLPHDDIWQVLFELGVKTAIIYLPPGSYYDANNILQPNTDLTGKLLRHHRDDPKSMTLTIHKDFEHHGNDTRTYYNETFLSLSIERQISLLQTATIEDIPIINNVKYSKHCAEYMFRRLVHNIIRKHGHYKALNILCCSDNEDAFAMCRLYIKNNIFPRCNIKPYETKYSEYDDILLFVANARRLYVDDEDSLSKLDKLSDENEEKKVQTLANESYELLLDEIQPNSMIEHLLIGLIKDPLPGSIRVAKMYYAEIEIVSMIPSKYCAVYVDDTKEILEAHQIEIIGRCRPDTWRKVIQYFSDIVNVPSESQQLVDIITIVNTELLINSGFYCWRQNLSDIIYDYYRVGEIRNDLPLIPSNQHTHSLYVERVNELYRDTIIRFLKRRNGHKSATKA